MYCIYRITNKLNNKTYIGQHKYKDLSIDEYMGSGKYICRAIKKHGIENFEREILISEIETKEEVDKLEKRYIELERESGHSEYNIQDGGSGGWLMNDDIKKKISEAHKGMHPSEETRAKLSIAHKGPNHYLYGKHISEDVKDKMRKPKSDLAKKHMSEASKGKPKSERFKESLSKSMKGENNPFYGKHHSEETKLRMSEAKNGNNHPMYGKHPSEETIKKLSKVKSGENHPMYGKHHSDKSKRQCSESMKGRLFYNNGIECHRFIPGTEPEGYTLGRLPKIKEN